MSEKRICVICVGNKLMLDEGIGPAVYEEMLEQYEIPENVTIRDVGCMSLDMIPYVDAFDAIITVDAVDGTEELPGTIFKFEPEDMARHTGANVSLHDLKLVDLFDAAGLLGYECEGVCLGMQVLNMDPEEYVIGLTEPCFEKLPLLVDILVGEIARLGTVLKRKDAEK